LGDSALCDGCHRPGQGAVRERSSFKQLPNWRQGIKARKVSGLEMAVLMDLSLRISRLGWVMIMRSGPETRKMASANRLL
jgi:hypothetical protein